MKPGASSLRVLCARVGTSDVEVWQDKYVDVGAFFGKTSFYQNLVNFLRVQVKSTTSRSGAGYRCQFMPNHQKKHDYTLDEIELFPAYVIPEDTWYLIPAVLLLGKRRKQMAMLFPVALPAKKASYCYEAYRENWEMLTLSRDELLEFAGPRSKIPEAERTSLSF